MQNTKLMAARLGKVIAAGAPALLLAAQASAQTTVTTTTTGVNTGAGADMIVNLTVLAVSALVGVAAVLYTRQAQLGQ